MSAKDQEFRQCAELLLQHRRAAYQAALEEIERAHGDSDASGQFARRNLINEWTGALQERCERVLSDLLILTKTFDAQSPEWIRQSFDGHVDELTKQISEKLANAGERRQVTNLASSVKARARDDIAQAIEVASKLRERAEENHSGVLDGLLPLHQRSGFDRDIVRMAQAATEEEPLGLLMLDLDHFKQVNDVHGHQSGDQVLIGVANILIDCLSQKGRAYRYGGEELAVLLPNYTVDEAAGFGERVRKTIEAAVLGKKALKVTASLGLAVAPFHANDSESLLEKADTALYEAKHGGRNRLCVSGN